MMIIFIRFMNLKFNHGLNLKVTIGNKLKISFNQLVFIVTHPGNYHYYLRMLKILCVVNKTFFYLNFWNEEFTLFYINLFRLVSKWCYSHISATGILKLSLGVCHIKFILERTDTKLKALKFYQLSKGSTDLDNIKYWLSTVHYEFNFEVM